MSSVTSLIHPTAVISPEAHIADDVQIGPYCVLEGEVRIGPGCVLGPYVHIVGLAVIGPENRIFTGAVLGEAPQHVNYHGEATRLEIGRANIIREHVTIHRGTTDRGVTHIGSHNFLMAGSHVAHDCILADRCQLANGALVGGHCTLDDGCIISGNATVHQHCRVGRLAMLGGLSGSSKDVPPFMMHQGINSVTGINVIGLRRAGIASASITALRASFRILFEQGFSLNNALDHIEGEMGEIPEVRELVEFIRTSKKGINRVRGMPRGLPEP
jgi:UDP-N-acetylglucosamine acyltransferase